MTAGGMRWVPVSEGLPRRWKDNPYNSGPLFVFHGDRPAAHGNFRFGVSCYWFGNGRDGAPLKYEPYWAHGPVTHWAYPEEPETGGPE